MSLLSRKEDATRANVKKFATRLRFFLLIGNVSIHQFRSQHFRLFETVLNRSSLLIFDLPRTFDNLHKIGFFSVTQHPVDEVRAPQ